MTTVADSGTGSLRAALEAANANAGTDVISIGVSGTINLETALPGISDNVEIEGPGQSSLTVRRNAGTFRIFSVLSNVSAFFSGMTISNGRSSQGAGIDSFGPLVLERVTVSGNEAVASGGTQAVAQGAGILSFGSLTMRESTVSGNTASASAGTSQTVAQEAGVGAFGTTIIERSTISGNVATATSSGTQVVAKGGGAILFGESSTVDRSTISGNAVSAGNGASQTVAQGGGIEGFEGLSIIGSTITGNSASSTQTAQGANLIGFEATIRDSIVSNPLGGTSSCSVPVTSGGFNVDDGTSCGFTQGTDLQSTNPGLDPTLADNGGPTRTHALVAGSAAIDHGNAFGAITDQRGMRRPSDFGAIPNVLGGDGSDIGAYELEDEVAPIAKIETGPLPRSRRVRARFTFSSNEPGSRFECRIDRGSSFTCSSPFTRRFRRKRSHLFEVEAIDVAGNRSVPAWRSWRVMRKRRRHHHHHRH